MPKEAQLQHSVIYRKAYRSQRGTEQGQKLFKFLKRVFGKVGKRLTGVLRFLDEEGTQEENISESRNGEKWLAPRWTEV